MEDLLKRAHAIVAGPVTSFSTWQETSRLAESLTVEADQADKLPDSISQLPREILLRIAELVKIPSELGFNTMDDDDELGDLTSRTTKELSNSFKRTSIGLLKLSIPLVRLLPTPSDPPERETLSFRSILFIAFSSFLQPDSSELFTTSELRDLANPIITSLLSPPKIRFPLLLHLLRHPLPIHFKPHPKLNPQTGRVLNRPLGGSDRGKDEWSEGAMEEEGWKRRAGLGGTVLKVIQSLEMHEVEETWQWLVPPILAYLDDFATTNKIIGLHLLDALLDKQSPASSFSSPSSLLVRTGVGKVFEQVQPFSPLFFSRSKPPCSPKTDNLSDPLSVKLQSLAQPISLKLIDTLYPSSSPSSSKLLLPRTTSTSTSCSKAKKKSTAQERFEALCRHFSSTTLQTWQYKGGNYELELLQLSFVSSSTTRPRKDEEEVKFGLIPWIRLIGKGSIRYLEILVPHLTNLVLNNEQEGESSSTWNKDMLRLRLGATKVLRELSRGDTAGLRMGRWEGVVSAKVARCWVEVRENKGVEKIRREGTEAERRFVEQMREELKGLVRDLRKVEGRGDRDYWKELEELDPMFEELVGELEKEPILA
ncbi:hypothetical protein JCM16303_002097 [Sporobolomyces ruberrimus]